MFPHSGPLCGFPFVGTIRGVVLEAHEEKPYFSKIKLIKHINEKRLSSLNVAGDDALLKQELDETTQGKNTPCKKPKDRIESGRHDR